MDAGPCSRSGRMGARGVVVIVTDNILTSSKVQSLSLLQLKRMHLMHLLHLIHLMHLLSLLSSGNFDAVRACCPAFLAHSRLFRCCCKERLEAVSALASLVLPCLLVIYAHIAITFIVIGKGPALVVVAAVFRTSHISHTFESGGCTS